MPGARVVEVGAEDAVVERVLDGEGLERKVERGDETWMTGVGLEGNLNSTPRMKNLADDAKSNHLARRGDVHEGHGRRGAIVTAAAAGQEFDALDTAESAKKGARED